MSLHKRDTDRTHIFTFPSSDLEVAQMTFGKKKKKKHDTSSCHKQYLCEVRTSKVFYKKDKDRTRLRRESDRRTRWFLHTQNLFARGYNDNCIMRFSLNNWLKNISKICYFNNVLKTLKINIYRIRFMKYTSICLVD